jgi:hypothetical protein
LRLPSFYRWITLSRCMISPSTEWKQTKAEIDKMRKP